MKETTSTKEKLLDAALTLFAENGFEEVISLNNIFYFANENTETKAT